LLKDGQVALVIAGFLSVAANATGSNARAHVPVKRNEPIDRMRAIV
jgi:hypothetical protein